MMPTQQTDSALGVICGSLMYLFIIRSEALLLVKKGVQCQVRMCWFSCLLSLIQLYLYLLGRCVQNIGCAVTCRPQVGQTCAIHEEGQQRIVLSILPVCC